MSCRRFQKDIKSFIEDDFDIDELDFFIEHAKNCRECYEELEINYMVNVGLDRIENDAKASFNLKGELEKKLKTYEEKSDNYYKFNVYKRIILLSAYGCMFAVIILSLFDFLGIF